MKFTLSFKTPDVFDELEMSAEDFEYAKDFAEKYVRWGECITIEFDTVAKTAVAKEYTR